MSTYTHPQPLQLLLLGTGTSSSLPSIGCLTNPTSGCFCCRSTLLKHDSRYEQEYRKNERRNTSAILRIPYEQEGDSGRKERTILIDCGKTFFSGALEHWPKQGLREIDALLLTHAHADAILGLDDLRGWTLRGHIQQSIPIYCTKDTFVEVQKAFPYLTDVGKATGGGDIPALVWNIIDPIEPCNLFGVEILPLPVEHGKFFTTPPTPFLCSGFLLNRQICYLSDVSSIPQNVWETLSHYITLPTPPPTSSTSSSSLPTTKMNHNGTTKEEDTKKIQDGKDDEKKPKLQALIVDCLRLEPFTSHFGFGQAVETSRKLGAKKNYLIGFGHRTSHTSWLQACQLASTPNSTSSHGTLLEDPPQFHELYNGHVDPLKEDSEVFKRRALQVVENWESEDERWRWSMKGEGEGDERVWIRPSCDGMTIKVGRNEGEVEDDEYVNE